MSRATVEEASVSLRRALAIVCEQTRKLINCHYVKYEAHEVQLVVNTFVD